MKILAIFSAFSALSQHQGSGTSLSGESGSFPLCWGGREGEGVKAEPGCVTVVGKYLIFFCLARLSLPWSIGEKEQAVFFFVCSLCWHFQVSRVFSYMSALYDAN